MGHLLAIADLAVICVAFREHAFVASIVLAVDVVLYASLAGIACFGVVANLLSV